jgi:membrane-associated protease RseP (regulator of RpoE activity)
MKTTPTRQNLAGDNSKSIGGASRSAMFTRTGRVIAHAAWPSKLMLALLFVVVGVVPLEVRADGYAPQRRSWLGLAAQDDSQGVMVVDVAPGSPAAAAGLRPGDQLGAVNGYPIRSHFELGRWVAAFPPGTVLRFSVRRGPRVHDVAVTLGDPPAAGPIRSTRPATPAPGPSRSSSAWSCRAVGTYAPPSSTDGPDYSDQQTIDVTKYGPTRDAAGIAALDVCSGMLRLQANPTLKPGSLVLDECRVISCSR